MANAIDNLINKAKEGGLEAAKVAIRPMAVQDAIQAYNTVSPAADQITRNDAIVINKMGFASGAQLLYFDAERNANPNLKGFFDDFTGDFASKSSYNAVLGKIGSRINQEGQQSNFNENAAKNNKGGVLDKLAKDLEDPTTKQSFRQALREHPEQVGTLFDDYADGKINLKQLSAQASLTVPAPSPVEAAVTDPEPAASASAVIEQAKPSKPKAAAHSHEQHKAEPMSQPAQDKTPANAAADLSAVKETARHEVLKGLAGLSDEQIQSSLEPRHVVQMADELANSAVDKYGVNAATAHGFHERISGDTKLQKDITENFKRHPDFVRQLAKQMDGDGNVPQNMQEIVRKEMTNVMENPESLASDKYVKDATGMMKNSGMMSGIGNFLQGMGIDMGGLGDSLGGFFQNIMQWFQDLVGAFTNGGVANFLAQPSNQGLGMFDKFAAGIGFAMNQAGNTYHSPYELAAQEVLPSRDGSYFHKEMGKDKDGNPVERTVPNTLELTDAGGKTHKVIPTAGPLPFEQVEGGNIKIRATTDIKQGADGRVSATSTGDFVVTRAEGDRYLQALEDQTGQKIALKQFGNEQKMAQQQPTDIQVTGVNGQTGNIEQTYSLPKQGDIKVEPIAQPNNPAANNSSPSWAITPGA